MLILAVAVALAIAAGITLLGLRGARDGYEDEAGFHAGTPTALPRIAATIRVEMSAEESVRAAILAAKVKDAVHLPPLPQKLAVPADTALVGQAILHPN
jgi:hypothetical protein